MRTSMFRGEGSEAVTWELGGESKRKCGSALTGMAVLLLLSATAWGGELQPRQVRTYANLLRILKQHQPQYSGARVSNPWEVFQGTDRLMSFSALSAAPAGSTAAGAAHSETLVQVSGVDEADQVKNDGTHIYQVNNGRVFIIRAAESGEPVLAATLDFTRGEFRPMGLFLDSQYLVVVGIGSREPIPRPVWRKWARLFSLPANTTVQARVYDIADPAQPQKVREVEIDGDYVGARKIGSTVYLVSRHYPQCYAMSFRTAATLRLATPGFRDTKRGKGFGALSPTRCYYLPEFDDPNYLVVAGVDLADAQSTVQMSAYLGAGESIYASAENLYVTASRQRFSFWWPSLGAPMTPTADTTGGLVVISERPPAPQVRLHGESSDIYKFSLGQGKPSFVCATRVPGTVLNSYSMDEYGGHLRVATTLRDLGRSENQVYVLDAGLNLTGKLENIAPGERIYAARFMGERLFLVTFRQVDPLFAIDLSDPANPVLGGELILPGYSDFLLPYDETHLIGLGKDATQDGLFQGMKLALFDVSDLTNPRLISSLTIGDRGTDSPALRDPHALLFDRDRNLLAFPVLVAEVGDSPGQLWPCSEQVFQGAYVFSVSLEAGFEFHGGITHLTDGVIWRQWASHVERVLTIGDDLFTLSSAWVKVNDLATLSEKGALALAQPEGIGIPFPPNFFTVQPAIVSPTVITPQTVTLRAF